MDGVLNSFNASMIAKGTIISLLHCEFTVQMESGMLYTFKEADNFIYHDTLYPHIVTIPFTTQEEIFQRRDAIEMAKMISGFTSSELTMINMTKQTSDEIRFVYNYLFREKEQPLVWRQKPNIFDSYSAIDRTAAYLATYSIDKANDHWMVCVSCSSNSHETYHAREYEFSSMEKTLADAKRQAAVFQQMISLYVKEDLRHT